MSGLQRIGLFFVIVGIVSFWNTDGETVQILFFFMWVGGGTMLVSK